MYTVPIPQSIFSEQTRASIGEAVYLLGYLILRSDWKNGITHVTHSAISEATGLPSRTIERWMGVLREHGFISTRRTAFGTLVTIHNYEPISRTHGVSYNAPTNPPRMAEPAETIPPNRADQPATSGGYNTPSTAGPSATGAGTNIKKVLSLNQINSFKRTSSSVDAPGAHPRETNDLDEPACKAIEAMTDADRSDLRKRTLEKMANSNSRYLTTFVRRDESGELGTYDEAGELIVTWQMIEMLKAEDS